MAYNSSPSRKLHEASISAASIVTRPIANDELVDTLASPASDVPHDLRQLIRAVSDHISEVEVTANLDRQMHVADRQPPPAEGDGESSTTDEDSCFRDDDDEHHMPLALISHGTNDLLRAYVGCDSGSSTSGAADSASPFSVATSSERCDSPTRDGTTSESFHGHALTAAAALRAMLEGPPREGSTSLLSSAFEEEPMSVSLNPDRPYDGSVVSVSASPSDSIRGMDLERPTVSHQH